MRDYGWLKSDNLAFSLSPSIAMIELELKNMFLEILN